MTFGKLRAIEAAAGGGAPKVAESAGPPAQDVPDQEIPVKAEAPEVSLLLEEFSDELDVKSGCWVTCIARLCFRMEMTDTEEAAWQVVAPAPTPPQRPLAPTAPATPEPAKRRAGASRR